MSEGGGGSASSGGGPRNFSEMTQEEIEEELERKRKLRNEKRAIKIRKKCATRPQVLKVNAQVYCSHSLD